MYTINLPNNTVIYIPFWEDRTSSLREPPKPSFFRNSLPTTTPIPSVDRPSHREEEEYKKEFTWPHRNNNKNEQLRVGDGQILAATGFWYLCVCVCGFGVAVFVKWRNPRNKLERNGCSEKVGGFWTTCVYATGRARMCHVNICEAIK